WQTGFRQGLMNYNLIKFEGNLPIGKAAFYSLIKDKGKIAFMLIVTIIGVLYSLSKGENVL
ncbi:hypothetical protein NLX67_22370, partial [Domibacillus sp. A3M-37]|uniref:hypothetical protein n=1 Tax=Domibacillus sp. A3M-37 TaxID=2962037 RepID=UPI0020B6CF93